MTISGAGTTTSRRGSFHTSLVATGVKWIVAEHSADVPPVRLVHPEDQARHVPDALRAAPAPDFRATEHRLPIQGTSPFQALTTVPA